MKIAVGNGSKVLRFSEVGNAFPVWIRCTSGCCANARGCGSTRERGGAGRNVREQDNSRQESQRFGLRIPGVSLSRAGAISPVLCGRNQVQQFGGHPPRRWPACRDVRESALARSDAKWRGKEAICLRKGGDLPQKMKRETGRSAGNGRWAGERSGPTGLARAEAWTRPRGEAPDLR
jgi:hypothetical protein